MKKRSLYRLVLLGLILAMAIAASVLTAAGPEACNLYYNSSPTWIQGYGGICAGTGGSCRECYGPNGSPTCVEDGGGHGCIDYPY